MASIDSLNILTNGDFSNLLTGWNVDNPSGNNAPDVFGGVVSFNSGNETVFGDSIDQDFVTTVGNTYAVTLDLIENNGGNANHTFQIDILDDTGTVVETVTAVAPNNSTNLVSFTFVATSTASNIRITNTTSTSSNSSDGKVDNVRVIDVTGNDDLDGTGVGEAIRGGPGNDTITGDDGNDALIGDEGNDAIYAGDGDDIAEGNDGNDELRGGNGNDTLIGGNDDDLIYAGNDDDVVFGGAGNDDIRASFGDDLFYGGDDDDRFIGSQLSTTDSVFGGDGKDTFQIISGAQWSVSNNVASSGGQTTFLNSIEIIIGSRQADTLSTSNSDIVEIFGGGGNDNVNGSDNHETLSGDAGVDTINGEGGNDVIYGGAGTDSLYGGDDVDILYGGSGNDGIYGGDQTDTLFGGDDRDIVDGGNGQDFVYGGEGDDRGLFGGAGNDMVFGGAGNDSVNGGAQDDTVFGGIGDDTVTGSSQNDLVYGGDGHDIIFGGGQFRDDDDTIFGDAGNDTIFGGGGRDSDEDTIFGGIGDDTVNGDTGNDFIDGGAGADSLFGGTGNDIFTVADDGSRNVVDGGTEVLYGGEDNTLDVSNFTSGVVYEFTGVSNPNVLVSDNGTEIEFSQIGFVIGTDFDDDIESVFFFDIDAGDGNDIVRVPGGRSNPQRFDGGDGIDTLDLSEGNTFVDLNLATGALIFTDGAFNFENAIGTRFNDTITGTSGANSIDGGDGNDTIEGDAGADSIDGGAGTGDTADYSNSGATVIVRLDGTAGIGGDAAGDTLTNVENLIGSANRDFLIGDANTNTLMGGAESDNLQGGGGADVLDGGAGFDFADYQEVTTTLTIDLANMANSSLTIQEDTLISIEGFAGAKNAKNIFNGSQGNDYFISGDLGDEIDGNDGNDTLRSERGNDTVNGGAGSDLIIGGLDDDILSGGGVDGAVDGFLFFDNHGNDVVTDFELGVDRLAWFSSTFNALGDLTLSTSTNGFALVTYGAATVEVLNVTEAQLNDPNNFFFF